MYFSVLFRSSFPLWLYLTLRLTWSDAHCNLVGCGTFVLLSCMHCGLPMIFPSDMTVTADHVIA